MEKRIKEYMENINQQYSKYSDHTAHCAELFKELLICDYNDFSSENKSWQYVKAILIEIITYAFENVGVKNYLKMMIGIFDVPEVKAFFLSTKIDTTELYKKLTVSKIVLHIGKAMKTVLRKNI
ncbi:MAG: hypothetical protein II101_01360 [Ruminococcus sp.]|nr:hypothetical protein [Ruminococcus sp.]